MAWRCNASIAGWDCFSSQQKKNKEKVISPHENCSLVTKWKIAFHSIFTFNESRPLPLCCACDTVIMAAHNSRHNFTIFFSILFLLLSASNRYWFLLNTLSSTACLKYKEQTTRTWNSRNAHTKQWKIRDCQAPKINVMASKVNWTKSVKWNEWKIGEAMKMDIGFPHRIHFQWNQVNKKWRRTEKSKVKVRHLFFETS